MSSNRELHLRIRGVEQLQAPGKSGESYDVYCIASFGHVRHRTRLIEDTVSPNWSEEFVFEGNLFADATTPSATAEPVIKFEIYNQGLFRDELLFYAYLDLNNCGVADSLEQQQRQQQGLLELELAKHRSSTATSRWGSAAGSDEDDQITLDAAAVAAAAAASRRTSDSSSLRVPGAAAARAAAEEASVTAATAAFRASCGSQGITGTGCPGFTTQVQTHFLAMLAAQGGSSGSSSSATLRSGERKPRSDADRGLGKVKPRKKRSRHVMSNEGGDLEVDVWWVQQPALGNAGTPPRVISFLHPPGVPHPLPSAAHTTLSSQWEEPAVAFVRLVISKISLGAAAAAAAGSSDGGSSSSSSRYQRSKLVLKRLRHLLREDRENDTEDQKQQQQKAKAALSQNWNLLQPGSSPPSSTAAAAAAAARGSKAKAAQWVWEGPEVSDPDESESSDYEDQSSQSVSSARSGTSRWSISGKKKKSSHSSSHNSPHKRVYRRSSIDGGLKGDDEQSESDAGNESDDEVMSLPDFDVDTSAQQQQQQHQSPSSSSSKAQRKEIKRQQDQHLFITTKIQLGDRDPKILQPIRLRSDGSADICQSAVFAVVRPLQEAMISYQLCLGFGPQGPPLLVLSFQYSLLHLLKRSPERSVYWEKYREIVTCTVSGLQVPLPCLPQSFMDISAFIADADYRAGMYSVPPVAAAALLAAAAEDAAAAAATPAAAIAAALDLHQPLTDSDSSLESSSAATAAAVAYDQDSICGSSVAGDGPAAAAAAAAGPDVGAGVLRRRLTPPTKQQQQQLQISAEQAATAAAAVSRQGPTLKNRAATGVGKVFNHALDKLPATMAHQIKNSKIMKRVFPARAEIFSIGQLRVPTFKQPGSAVTAAAAAAAANQHSSSGSSSAAGPISVPRSYVKASSWKSTTSAHSTVSAVSGCSLTSTAAAAVAHSALGRHPNVMTSGDHMTRPLGVLQLTLQSITLRTSSSSSSGGGVQLLMRCGPHWLQLQQPALPLSFQSSSSSGGGGSSSTTGSVAAVISSSRVAPVQVLLPVFGSSSLVSIVLHRKGSVIGRSVFKLFGLLPLLLRDHTKTLTLYSDKRGTGGRVVVGSILLRLAAGPPPSYSRTTACIRLFYSYIITPYTLELHSSGVLSSISREGRDDIAGELVLEWMEQQGKHALTEIIVHQLVSTGRDQLCGARMRGHVRRIKSVLIDWLPRRWDPLAFYYWKRPWYNILVIYIMSHALLEPSKWLFGMAVIMVVTLFRRMAIQIRHGVLGFEIEQLPPDMAAAAALPPQQQQQQQHMEASSAAEPDTSAVDDDMVGYLQSLRTSGAHLGEKARQEYRDAADKFRSKLTKGGKLAPVPSYNPPVTFPSNLDELRDQLQHGTLNLDTLTLESVQQLLSLGGLLKFVRHHIPYLANYFLVLQNILDDIAGFIEGLYAMVTAQDPLAAIVFCAIIMAFATFWRIFGFGAFVYVFISVLLRPPCLRGVPGVFGLKALLANLPTRSVEDLAW